MFERLITWAAAAIETSSNQPVLPHAIIVLNASENDLDEKLWDVPANTESILEDLARTVNRNETFKKWAQFWRERGKEINTLTDLVLCYYSSVQVRTSHDRPFDSVSLSHHTWKTAQLIRNRSSESPKKVDQIS